MRIVNDFVGVILAGGLGTRVGPTTKYTNKHLIPVNSIEMVLYPLRTLVKAGIKDIIIITGGKTNGFLPLLSDGRNFGVKIQLIYQSGNGGIADALSLTERHVGNRDIVVVLGDNYFDDDIGPLIKDFTGGGRGFF